MTYAINTHVSKRMKNNVRGNRCDEYLQIVRHRQSERFCDRVTTRLENNKTWLKLFRIYFNLLKEGAWPQQWDQTVKTYGRNNNARDNKEKQFIQKNHVKSHWVICFCIIAKMKISINREDKKIKKKIWEKSFAVQQLKIMCIQRVKELFNDSYA